MVGSNGDSVLVVQCQHMLLQSGSPIAIDQYNPVAVTALIGELLITLGFAIGDLKSVFPRNAKLKGTRSAKMLWPVDVT